MQYGLRLDNYKRVEGEKRILIGEGIEKYIIIFFTSLLISRAILLVSKGDSVGLAPFGIAILVSLLTQRDFKRYVVSSVAVAIGYTSVLGRMGDDFSNIVIVAMLLGGYAFGEFIIGKRMKDKDALFIIFGSYLLYGLFINRYDIGSNISLSLIKTVMVMPVAYVLRYGINSIREYGTSYLFSLEELISMGILICLIVSGFGNVAIFTMSMRSIVAYILILVVAYCGGGTYGAAIGTTMGIIIGLNSGDMIMGIAVFATVGLVSGIFRDTGRIFASLAFLIMFIGMSLYSNTLSIGVVLEVILAGVAFVAIPSKFIEKIEVEVSSERKSEDINVMSLQEQRDALYGKIRGISVSFKSIADTLKAPGDNSKLLINKKGSALVENLVDRVCAGCIRQEVCWNREFSITLNSFHTLIENCEERKMGFPSVLEKKCKKKFELINCAEKIVENQKGEEVLRGKLEEGRKLIASHVETISKSIEGILLDCNSDINIQWDVDNQIKRALNKNNVNYKGVTAYRDNSGREIIKIKLEGEVGDSYYKKQILPIVVEVMKKPMTIMEDGISVDAKTKECTIAFQELPKYFLRSYGAKFTKAGEEYSGDAYSFGKGKDGKYVTLLSDGMGSGPVAGRESNATINLIEDFLAAGLSKETSVNMINSIVGLKFDEDEKFSTLDMNVVDLYSGEVEFVKIGGVASFLKRDDGVEIVESNMPPFGLLDSMEIEDVTRKVGTGDILITLSDGVLDIDKKNVGVYSWMKSYLKGASKDPRQLSQDIIEKAREMSGGICNDDMTVVVSKVYSMY